MEFIMEVKSFKIQAPELLARHVTSCQSTLSWPVDPKKVNLNVENLTQITSTFSPTSFCAEILMNLKVT
jgi:hypothetical protein